MKRRFGYKHMLLGLTLALAVTGCANAKTGGDPAPQGTQGGGKTQTGAPEAKQLKVKTYYADDNLDKLIEREASISYTSEADKYKAALTALQKSPEAALFPLSKGLTFKTVQFKDGGIVVDLSISDEGRLGAPGEQLLIDSILRSLFQFSEVQSIELLVDGKQTESLMGHVSLLHPYKRK